jgi:opacity protein-like surface antigen
MKLTTACLGLGAALAMAGAAKAAEPAYGPSPVPAYGAGLKERDIPAPIPVPMPVPVPEGFTYYLRADLNWGWASNSKFSESGAVYGEDAVLGQGPFTSSAIPFSAGRESVFGGTIGFGAYFTPRLRGDLTLDFRQDKTSEFNGTYAYNPALTPANTVNGVVRDSFKTSSVVGLANLYLDLLPRGTFTPYIGGGIGFVYNQFDRNYLNTETQVDGLGATVSSRGRAGATTENGIGLAAALMAGVTIAFDHRWALDVSYRALYMDGGTATVTIPSFVGGPAQTSRATLGDQWEQQVRVGLRFNIW